eukprot:925245-Pelagomonas_calceolata.AAC.22
MEAVFQSPTFQISMDALTFGKAQRADFGSSSSKVEHPHIATIGQLAVAMMPVVHLCLPRLIVVELKLAMQ